MAKTTFIKLDRDILNWRWAQDPNTFNIFVHLLLLANWKEHEFEGVTIHPGDVVTSYPKLAQQSGLTVQNVRTAIKHLKSTGEITATTYPKFTVISIPNYAFYQTGNRQANRQLTGNQQAPNRQANTIQEYNKNDKKEKNIYIGDNELQPCGKLLFLSDNQFKELEDMCEPAELIAYIDRVDDWLAAHPTPKKSHYQVIKKFITNDKEK